MADAALVAISPQTLDLARKLLGDEKATLTPEQEKAAVHLADDEWERLSRDEKRAFWNDVVKRELKRNGVGAAAIASSGIAGIEVPTSVALGTISQQGAPAAEGVKKSLARLRSLVVDCVACEGLSPARFKAEDDRCRVCGELLPVSPEFGVVRDAAQVAALVEEHAPVAPAAPEAEPAPEISWELLSASPDLQRLLVLSKENEDWDERTEAMARAEAEAKKKAEDEAAKKKAEEEKRARDAAEQKAQEERARADAEAKKRAEEENKAREAAEQKARAEKARADAEAKKKADEEAKQKAVAAQKAAEAEFLRQEAEAKKKAEEEAAAKVAADAAAEKERLEKEAEEEARRKAEDSRLAIGCLTGPQAGKIVRIEDLDPAFKPSGNRPLVLMVGGAAKILVPASAKAWVNDAPAQKIVPLKSGDVIRGLFEEDDLAVVEENGELRGVNAGPVHFKREDGGAGGPWNYWNEPVKIGSADGSEVLIVDPGVEDTHATVETRFGRVVVEAASRQGEGLWVGDARVQAFIARPALAFKLGKEGPALSVQDGHAEVKETVVAKAGAMKPARYVRTCLHVEGPDGETSKVFLFARREIRFGSLFSKADKVENDLVISPADELQTVAQKQGSLSLTRDGVALRLDDKKVGMSLNDDDLRPGQSLPLKRRFTIAIGSGITLQGEVYRAPSSIARDTGPGQLGVEGGHPYECVKMVRDDSSGHTYVFLVRQIRLGSSKNDSIQLSDPKIGPGHATIVLARGVLQIVAPRPQYTVELEGKVLETAVPYPLKLGATFQLGDTKIRFAFTEENDFKIDSGLPEE